jgi:cytochrome oxidase assembly protein ShyY1
MNNEFVFGLMAIFGSIFAGLQLWQIKRISDLCERVTRMETEIEHHFNGKHDKPEGRRFA